MKIITTLIFLTTFLTFSQTKSETKIITENYNKETIVKFTKKINDRFNKEKNKALKQAKLNGWSVIIKGENIYKELMRLSPEGFPIYYTINNVNAAKSTRANTLHNGGLLNLNLEGQNMIAYVWDGGIAKATHQEYDGIGGNNRYSSGEGAISTHYHAAHVTGTIIASGLAPSAKGMAPQASAIGYDWNNDVSEVSARSLNGMLVSNHSYGLIATDIPDWIFGAYNQDAHDFDQIMYNAPFYLLVSAAGNDGQDSSSNANPLGGNASYDKLTGDHTTSKNSLVVANANDANIDSNGNLIFVSINPSSSQGPTDDLRVKPDITGNGTQLYSTSDNADDDYQSLSGTSMASPNVAGTLLLLQQHYNNINNHFMKAATLKGLALHTADDVLNSGPDAIYGWGLLNAKAAVNTITNNGVESIINEVTLNQGESYTIGVKSDDINSLLASISWTDSPGSVNSGTVNSSTPVLVNDLDIRVTKGSNTFLPYKLTSVNTNGIGDNIVDPFERIDIENASGIYTITVTHKGSLFSGQQNFSLIVTGLQFNGVCTAPIPVNINATPIVFFKTTVNWDIIIGTTYEVRYRELYTSPWTMLTTNNPTIDITGIDPNKTYEIQVRSICPDGTTISNYSNSIQVGAAASINNLTTNIFKAYPNPVKDNLTIEGIDIITNVSIFNMLGQKVLSTNPNETIATIKLISLNHGTYFTKVTINGATETVKIIK